MKPMQTLRDWARRLKQHSLTLYCAARDPRTPRLARLLALLVAAYALSPLDLIPDFIPLLGYLDDLILLPLGIWLVLRLIPRQVWDDSQARAAQLAERPVSRGAAAVIVLLWLLGLTLGGLWLARLSH